jgi:hypothetical protein
VALAQHASQSIRFPPPDHHEARCKCKQTRLWHRCIDRVKPPHFGDCFLPSTQLASFDCPTGVPLLWKMFWKTQNFGRRKTGVRSNTVAAASVLLIRCVYYCLCTTNEVCAPVLEDAKLCSGRCFGRRKTRFEISPYRLSDGFEKRRHLAKTEGVHTYLSLKRVYL